MSIKGKGSRLSDRQLAEFLENVSEAHTVKASAKAAGISTTSVYERRKWDDVFDGRWHEATELGVQVLEEEVRRRAVEGFVEPVYYRGEKVGEVRKWSDNLLMFRLKGLKPEVYRDHFEGRITVQEESEFDREIKKLVKEMDAKEGAGTGAKIIDQITNEMVSEAVSADSIKKKGV
jgi:AcrR family transcriptional regulator